MFTANKRQIVPEKFNFNILDAMLIAYAKLELGGNMGMLDYSGLFFYGNFLRYANLLPPALALSKI